MIIAFVHGNPETDAIWADLLEHFAGDDVVLLSPPGFGAPLSSGFACTVDAYRDWLAESLETLPGPVDLIGHDWGGGHVMRIAMDRPKLIRSWITDVAGIFDPEYQWHDRAQTWQTPGAGEQAVAAMVSMPAEERAKMFQSLGMSEDVARNVSSGMNEEMGKAILTLYRSAAQPVMKELGERLPEAAANPGLVLIPTKDHYTGGEVLARRSAERAGAQIAILEGLGHWWMCENPKKAAEAIKTFLNTVN